MKKAATGFVTALTLGLGLAVVAALSAPDTLSARVSAPAFAGDSVRYAVSWSLPTTPLDSVVVRWSLTGNSNQRHSFTSAPFPTADEGRFFAPASIPGGATFNGDVIIETWAGGLSSAVARNYSLTIPDTPPPDPVSAVAFTDSAVVY